MKIILLGTVVSSVFNFRLNLIESLVAKGFLVYVFCVDFDEASEKRIKRIGAIPVRYKMNRAGLNPFKDILNTWSLYKIFKKISPDLVLSYFVKPVIFGAIASKFASVPRSIGMLEGLGYVFTDLPTGVSRKQSALRIVQVFLYRLALPLLDKIIFLNPDDKRDLLDLHEIRVKNVIILGGIGVDLNKYAYTPLDNKKPPCFIFVGRLLLEKGIREYISAARIVKKRYPATRFVVLGGIDSENPGGISYSQLGELVSSGIVEYPGQVSSVAEWLGNSSVFVLPSYREGVPCSTQEAMSVGRAIITSDVPGCRETVIDGVNGFLVPRWNVEILAQKILYFIENKPLIEKMGRESRLIAEQRFNAVEVNERLIKILLN